MAYSGLPRPETPQDMFPGPMTLSFMVSHCFSTTFNAFSTLYPLSSEIVPLFTGPNWQFRSAPGQEVLVTSKGIVLLTFASTVRVQMPQDAMKASISIRHTYC